MKMNPRDLIYVMHPSITLQVMNVQIFASAVSACSDNNSESSMGLLAFM